MKLLRVAIAAMALTLLVVTVSPVLAAPVPGGSCTKEGRTRRTTAGVLRCVKSDRQLQWVLTATKTTYALGDTGPGGGTVFYVHPGGGTFASPGSDCGSSCMYLEHAPIKFHVGALEGWCGDNLSFLGAVGTAIGTGMSNTTTAARTCTSGAIHSAASYANNGKTDWHLPSLDELNEQWKACKCYGWTIHGHNLWSSSEWTASRAWAQSFQFGPVGDVHKLNMSSTYYFVPVRAFGTSTTTSTSTTTTPPLSCAMGGRCVVGDTGPGGGTVYYVHPGGGTFASPGSDCGTTCRYLEYAPAPPYPEKWYRWLDSWFDLPGLPEPLPVPGARGTGIGEGMANTNAIVQHPRSDGMAARYAFDYENAGKTDWHLPSQDELYWLLAHPDSIGRKDQDLVREFSGNLEMTKTYWSSTQVNDTMAFYNLVNDCRCASWWKKKGDYNQVRPVRAF